MSIPLIRLYSGRAVQFNLEKIERVQGHNPHQQQLKMNIGINNNEEVISEYWEDEHDGDHYLIIRVIYSNGYPWLVVHQGVNEVVKAPLYVPAVFEDDIHLRRTVTLHLRCFANRGNKTCIKRKFYFHFLSEAEAEGFVKVHNSMLKEYDEAKEEPATSMTTTLKMATTADSSVDSSSVDTIDLLNQSESSSNSVEREEDKKVNESIDRRKEEDNCDDLYHTKKLNEFHNGDAKGNFIDDFQEFTQNPWDDESF